MLKEMANAIRSLTIDSIERANSGHPGMPLGMADVSTVLFKDFLKFDPTKPNWKDRDRLILSAGHGSMLLYSILYLTGYKDCNLNQLKKFRQIGSLTAGHPEYGLLKGTETTTGPLGQGIANAVGMAIAENLLNRKFGNYLVDHKTIVIAGDGCLMEGLSQESISLAGHLKLKKLIILFDNNGISIDGKTSLTTSDNQMKRFEASNWNTIEIDGHNHKEIKNALQKSYRSDKPSIISCKTIIGYGSPNKEGTENCHGSPLGEIEANLTKEKLGITNKPFSIPKNILNEWRKIGKFGINKRLKWEKKLSSYKNKNEFLNHFKDVNYSRNKEINSYLNEILKTKKDEASRKSSQNSIEIISSKIKKFLGGSADLTGSNLTKTKHSVTKGKSQNYIFYGVREHLMAGAMNGISLHGGFLCYGGTFLIFSDYCKNSIRLSALMKQQVIYVFTHDSIGLGEDGPTHQPVEQLAGLRSIPNLLVFRPCDAIETHECWELAIMHKNSPSAIALSRQSLPLLRNNFVINKSSRGGYLIEKNKDIKLTLIATGSEVSLAKKVKGLLLKENINANILSLPCFEIFDRQTKDYKDSVLGEDLRVVIEAASGFGWHKYLREKDLIFCLDNFGESGTGKEVFKFFGFDEHKIKEDIINRLGND